MAEIDSITREALKRAAQIKSRIPNQNTNPVVKENNVTEKSVNEKSNSIPKIKPRETPIENNSNNSFLNNLLGNKEQNIILILLVILMNENSDPSIILALLYLLM